MCLSDTRSCVNPGRRMNLSRMLVLLVLLLNFSYLQTSMADVSSDAGFCEAKCASRCSKAGVKDRCLKYCGVCCQECKCVPAGTYGNKEQCPCYRDKLNKNGKPKCP